MKGNKHKFDFYTKERGVHFARMKCTREEAVEYAKRHHLRFEKVIE